MPKVVQYLHYQTDAEGLVVVVDSNRSPLAAQSLDKPAGSEDLSRTGRLQRGLRVVRARLASVPQRPELKVALGLAVPTIEAWYRCGLDHRVNEATWRRALESQEYPYDGRRLKQDVYGTERPSLELARKVVTGQAQRLVGEQRLGLLKELFPIGFGSLANELRNW